MPPKRKAATRVADEAAAAKKGKVDGEFYWDNVRRLVNIANIVETPLELMFQDAPSRDVLPNVFYRIAKVRKRVSLPKKSVRTFLLSGTGQDEGYWLRHRLDYHPNKERKEVCNRYCCILCSLALNS